MTSRTLPEVIDGSGSVVIELRLAPAGEPSPAWEVEAVPADRDRNDPVYEDGDDPKALWYTVAAFEQDDSIREVRVTVWLEQQG